MKYKTRISTEIANAAENIRFVVPIVANARTPSPRNPIDSTTIDDTKARHKAIRGFLLFISYLSFAVQRILTLEHRKIACPVLRVQSLSLTLLRSYGKEEENEKDSTMMSDIKWRIYPLRHSRRMLPRGRFAEYKPYRAKLYPPRFLFSSSTVASLG